MQAVPCLLACSVRGDMIVTFASCTAVVHTGYPGWGDFTLHRESGNGKDRSEFTQQHRECPSSAWSTVTEEESSVRGKLYSTELTSPIYR